MCKLLIIVLVCIVSACGFHLRGTEGSYRLPFKSVYLDCNNVIICSNLHTAIKIQNFTNINNKIESAEAVITLFDEQTSRDPQAFNSVGRIAAYLLTYQIKATVTKNNLPIGKTIVISVNSIMNYNDSVILATNQNEVIFWNNLHQKATNQLIYQLVHVGK